ncbi:hypothetical protein [Amycolatopsis eburnea]|uniref:Uncharacterized protein n=1 Tax=Amycolatopsis eburnea TaxID=2267691 RepID=A0A427TPR0_9PSEU|nr:hypothetical protein [Amycolatopsis eburnea]RSD26380.1 hypothetical protein EIY87_00515 [Amycolatopsis eburnea]
MVKPSKDPKPAGPIRRAARGAARQVNLRAAGQKVEEIFAEELDTPPPASEDGQRAELKRAVLSFTRLTEALRPQVAALLAAGVFAATAAAAFVAAVEAGLDKPTSPDAAAPTEPAVPYTPPVRPSCDEPAAGCPQRGDAAEGR